MGCQTEPNGLGKSQCFLQLLGNGASWGLRNLIGGTHPASPAEVEAEGASGRIPSLPCNDHSLCYSCGEDTCSERSVVEKLVRFWCSRAPQQRTSQPQERMIHITMECFAFTIDVVCLLRARPMSGPHTTYKVGLIIMPIVQMKKLRSERLSDSSGSAQQESSRAGM